MVPCDVIAWLLVPLSLSIHPSAAKPNPQLPSEIFPYSRCNSSFLMLSSSSHSIGKSWGLPTTTKMVTMMRMEQKRRFELVAISSRLLCHVHFGLLSFVVCSFVHLKSDTPACFNYYASRVLFILSSVHLSHRRTKVICPKMKWRLLK